MAWLRFPALRVAGMTFGAMLAMIHATFAQMPTAASSAADFKVTYDAAMAEARETEALDPAYELLGVAGNARTQNLNDMANSAADAFAALIQRATLAAQRKGAGYLQDTLDQLVDLRFFAETTRIPRATQALDTAMRALFAPVARGVEQQMDAAATWEDKTTALRELVSLEASATQVKLADVAKSIGAGVDMRLTSQTTAASMVADPAERQQKLKEIEDFKHTRSEQIREAAANDMSKVAQQIESGGSEGSTRQPRSEDGGPVSEDLLDADGSCVETGLRLTEQMPISESDLHRAQQRECVNSGRVPTTERCSTANLSFVCYTRITDGERITYAYRGTAAEAYFRQACAAGDLVPGMQVAKNGAPFRSPDVQLSTVCAPSGSPGE